MKVPKWALLMGIVALTTWISCGVPKSSSEHRSKSAKEKCPEGLMCTMDFKMYNVHLKDAKGHPIVLDNYEILLANDTLKHFKAISSDTDYEFSYNGIYTLINDGDKHLTTQSGTPLIFKGYKDGQLIARLKYVVAHDCCHVLVKEGNLTVVLDKFENGK